MSDETEIADFEEKVFDYLDDLRESGVINMFGAGRYIQVNFGVDRAEASRLLSLWMATYSERHP